ncbi:MAG: histidine kinase [Actinomycetia bacterium]|nr:histidine kinase [Actinomycetes bacterium]
MEESGAPATGLRGWDIWAGCVLVTLGLSTATMEPILARWLWELIAFAAWYVVVGRRAIKYRGPMLPEVYMAGSAALLGWAAYRDPWLAPLQIIAVPLVWWFCLPQRKRALAWTIVTCAAAAAGLASFKLFVHWDEWSTAKTVIYLAVVPVVIVVASIVAGTWADDLFRWGRDRANLVADLRRMEEDRIALEREAAAAEERLRLSREIHDTIAQDIAGLRLLTERARRLAHRADQRTGAGAVGGDAAPTPLDATLTSIASAADTVFAETRSLIASTAPALPGPTTRTSIVRVVDRFTHETGIVVTAEVADLALPREAALVVVRCVQEGLANVRKHAHAGRIWLTLAADGDAAVLTITDDGAGMAEGTVPGFGLRGMAARVHEAGGVFAVEPAGEDRGVRLRVSIPLRDVADDVPEPA